MAQPLPLDYIQDPDIQRNFEKLAGLFPDFGGRTPKVRFGIGTITWPGANSVSTTVAITHGLGTTPVVVLATINQTVGLTYPIVQTSTFTATQFSADARTSDGTSPAGATTMTFSWLAVG